MTGPSNSEVRIVELLYGDEVLIRTSLLTDLLWRAHAAGRGMTHSGPTWLDCPHSLCTEGREALGGVSHGEG